MVNSNLSPAGNAAAPVPAARPQKLPAKIWGSLYPVLIFLGMQFAVGIGYSVVLMVVFILQAGPAGAQDPSVYEKLMKQITQDSLLITLIIDVVLMPIYILLYRFDRKKFPAQKTAKIGPVDYITVALLAVGANFLISSVILGFKLYEIFPDYVNLGNMIGNTPLPIRFLTVGIVAPIVEEFLMRGLVLNRMRRYMPVIPAIILQALIFGLIHMNVIQSTYAAFLGLILGYLYVRYNSLLPCLVLHFVLNSMSVLMPESFGADWNPLIYGSISLLIVAGLLIFVELRRRKSIASGFAAQPVTVPAEDTDGRE